MCFDDDRFADHLEAEYESRWKDPMSQVADDLADDDFDEPDDGFTDSEADADALASAGYGTDEDYGFYGDYEDFFGEY